MSDQPANVQPASPLPAMEKPEPEPLPLRLFFSMAWGTLAIVVGAIVWGLVAYFSNTVYVIIAVFIGMAVASAILMPLCPMHKAVALLFLPVAVTGSLLSILLGESLFTVLYLIRDQHASVIEAVTGTLDNLGVILAVKDTKASLTLGLFGALIGYFMTWKNL